MDVQLIYKRLGLIIRMWALLWAVDCALWGYITNAVGSKFCPAFSFLNLTPS